MAEGIASLGGNLGEARLGVLVLLACRVELGLGVLEALLNVLKVLAGLEVRVDLVDLGLALVDRVEILAMCRLTLGGIEALHKRER